VATFADCEAEWLEPPENRNYDIWVDRVLDCLMVISPKTEASDQQLNDEYNKQAEFDEFDPESAAENISSSVMSI